MSPIVEKSSRPDETEQTRQWSDQELLAQFANGRNELAFQELVCRHGPMVLDVCRCVLTTEADAEDAFQATFLILARKARSIRQAGSVGSWLYGVAYRTALNARKKLARRSKHEKRTPPRNASAHDELSWSEVQRVLHEELSGLTERYRAPLVLCYLQNRTQDEAASHLGLAKSTLRKRLEQGRTLLQARLVRRGLGPAALLLASAWPGLANAAVPPALAATTAHAASLAASGQALSGVVSAQVTSLTTAGLSVISNGKISLAVIILMALLGLGSNSLLSFLFAAQAPTTEFVHDFRDGKPLPAWLTLDGPVEEAEINLADAGMRVTLPAERKSHFAVGVETKLIFSGDFEITAAFELLSFERPATGYGVGVSLNLARAADRKLFGKIARFWRPEEGNVFISEFWNNDPPKFRRVKSVPTETRTGRLRLVREGDTLRYLAAEGFDGDFQEVYQAKFTADDLAQLRLVVSDSGAPGNAVDARLLELRIVGGKLTVLPAKLNAAAPPDAPAEKVPLTMPPVPPEIESDEPQQGRSFWWLLALIVAMVMLAAGLAQRWIRRKRLLAVNGEIAPTLVTFACSACRRNLKARAELAGKKVKCPQCSQATLVPGIQQVQP